MLIKVWKKIIYICVCLCIYIYIYNPYHCRNGACEVYRMSSSVGCSAAWYSRPTKGTASKWELLGFRILPIENKIWWWFFKFKKCVNLHWFLNLLWIPDLRNTVHHWLFYYLTAIDKASVHKVPEKVNIYWFYGATTMEFCHQRCMATSTGMCKTAEGTQILL